MNAPGGFTVSSTSATILNASDARNYAAIFNNSSSLTVYLAFGTGVTAVASAGLALAPQAGYVFDRQGVTQQAIQAATVSGTARVTIQTGT